MEESKKKELLSGMFAGATIQDSVVVGIAESGSNVFYSKGKEERGESSLPSDEKMKEVIARSVEEGYWWGNRSWAVVFRVYQMKKYKGSVSHFIEKASQWDIKTGYELNYDAVHKPLTDGRIVGPLEKWEENGVPNRAIKLCDFLLEKLDDTKGEKEPENK